VLAGQKYSGSSAALTQNTTSSSRPAAARQRGTLRRQQRHPLRQVGPCSALPVMPYSAETAMRNSADPVRFEADVVDRRAQPRAPAPCSSRPYEADQQHLEEDEQVEQVRP